MMLKFVNESAAHRDGRSHPHMRWRQDSLVSHVQKIPGYTSLAQAKLGEAIDVLKFVSLLLLKQTKLILYWSVNRNPNRNRNPDKSTRILIGIEVKKVKKHKISSLTYVQVKFILPIITQGHYVMINRHWDSNIPG